MSCVVRYCQSKCYNFFHTVIIFTLTAAKILLQRRKQATNPTVITIISVGWLTTRAIVQNLSRLSDAVSSSLRMILSYLITCYGPHSRSVRLFLKWSFLAFPYSITSVWVSLHVHLRLSGYLFHCKVFLEITYACCTLQYDPTTCGCVRVRGCKVFNIFNILRFPKWLCRSSKIKMISDSSKHIRYQ